MLSIVGSAAQQYYRNKLEFGFSNKRWILEGEFSKELETSEVLKTSEVFPSAVAVFYKNPESEILDILKKYPFKTVQLYAEDVSPEFVRSLKHRVILAVKINDI